MSDRTTLVLGASTSEMRYSNIATHRLLNKGESVYLLGKTTGDVQGNTIHQTWPDFEVHTVTLYLSSKHQEPFYEQIIKANPKRVIFNPGTENPEFEHLLSKSKIPFEHSCTLVLLSTNQY